MEMINAIGRRKASIARVYLTKGEGKIVVNGKDYKEYFPLPHIQGKITAPFKTVMLKEVDIKARLKLSVWVSPEHWLS